MDYEFSINLFEKSNLKLIFGYVQNHHSYLDSATPLSASRTQDLADVSRMLGLADETQLIQIRAIIKQYLSNAEEDLESLILLGKLEIGY